MSTGRWGDEPSDHQTAAPPSAAAETAPQAAESGPPRRKKLALKPRGSSTSASTTASAKSSIFGAAKPREEVLASKGIDAKLVDERITKKATAVHYSREQNEEIQAIQAELTRAEADLRNANENELPEASFQKVVDTKRKELHDLMEQYQKENEEKQITSSTTTKGGERKHYERPSERKKRLEEQGGGGGDGGVGGNRYDHHEEQSQEDVFQHFGGRNQSQSHRGSGHY